MKAPKPVRQGGMAAPNVQKPMESGKSPTVNTNMSTPGMGASPNGIRPNPIGGKGTVGKPGAIVKPPCC